MSQDPARWFIRAAILLLLGGNIVALWLLFQFVKASLHRIERILWMLVAQGAEILREIEEILKILSPPHDAVGGKITLGPPSPK